MSRETLHTGVASRNSLELGAEACAKMSGMERFKALSPEAQLKKIQASKQVHISSHLTDRVIVYSMLFEVSP